MVSKKKKLLYYSSVGVTPAPIPDFLGNKLVAYYIATPENVVVDDSRKISQLTDLSGNGHHLVQPTAARRPTYNMVDRITFASASQQYLINNSIIAALQGTSIGVYGMFQSTTADVFLVNFCDTDGSAFMGMRNTTTLQWGGTGSTASTGVAAAKNDLQQILGVQINNDVSINGMIGSAINTVADVSISTLADLPAIDNMTIGARILATPAYLNMFMKSLVVTNGQLTLQELADLYTFLAAQDVVLERVLIAELGQSNMEGRDGDLTNAAYPFISGKGFEWTGTQEVFIKTTRGGAVGERGSHANYFCEKFYELTGKAAVMIECATGSTGLTATATTPNWSSGSTLRSGAVTKINSALTFYSRSAPDYALWTQGESDAITMIANPAYTKAIVKAALQDVIDWWQTTYPGVPFIISELGVHNTGSPEEQGWIDMRAIQNEIVEENTGVYIGFAGAKNFTVGQMYDVFHYNYLGYAVMGEALGTYVASME
jgi:hypothetical protein